MRKPLLLPLLLTLILLLPSCTARDVPRPCLPYIVEGTLTSPEMSGRVRLVISEDGSTSLSFTEGELEGYTYTSQNGLSMISHGDVSAPLPFTPEPIAMLREALTLPEESLVSAEARDGNTISVYRGASGDITLTLPDSTPAFPLRAEYGELVLTIERADFRVMNSSQTNG